MWAVIVGIGVVVGIVAGVTQVWDVFRADAPPVVQHDVVTRTVAPPAAATHPCWETPQSRIDGPDFDICMNSNLDLNERAEVKAFPGALVLVNIKFTNTGRTQLDNVVLRAQPDPDLSFDRDSARLIWSGNPGGVHLTPQVVDALSRQGVNVGSYASQGSGYVSFYVRVAASDRFDCGTSRRVVSAHADTTAGSKGADIVLAVLRQC